MEFAQVSKKHKRRRKISLRSISAILGCLTVSSDIKIHWNFFNRAVILPTVKEISYFIT